MLSLGGDIGMVWPVRHAGGARYVFARRCFQVSGDHVMLPVRRSRCVLSLGGGIGMSLLDVQVTSYSCVVFVFRRRSECRVFVSSSQGISNERSLSPRSRCVAARWRREDA